jgi:5'-nucleotidase
VFYSGTIAGAREAAMRGIPAIAFSTFPDADFTHAASEAVQLARRLMQVARPDTHAVLLNVNFPKQPARGVRVSSVGRQVYEERVIPRLDPSGREYFWIGGRVTESAETEGTDAHALSLGYASITPLALEATSSEHWAAAAFVAGQESA